MPKKVTLADVAELANVAVGTASEALNRRTGIAPATRDRVLTAARQLGYDQRIPFEEPKRTSLKSVGVIKHEQHDYPGFDPFYFPVVAGIERRCQGDGLTMTYATCEVDAANQVTRLPATLASSRVDGLIIVGAFLPRPFAREVNALPYPVVLVDGYAEGERFDRILTNNVDGACEAVTYLMHNGHQHIGLIGSCEACYPSIRERREGYQRALQRNGIADAYIEDSPLNRQAAYDATLNLLKRAPQLTALFVVNDNAAFGAIAAARSLGREVPEHLSVVGFDDIMFAADMAPPLTTMRIDKTRMGDLAAQMLAYRTANPDAPVMTWSLDTTLIERKSVRSIRTARKASS
jgi:LacI family transcriptional regulator